MLGRTQFSDEFAELIYVLSGCCTYTDLVVFKACDLIFQISFVVCDDKGNSLLAEKSYQLLFCFSDSFFKVNNEHSDIDFVEDESCL